MPGIEAATALKLVGQLHVVIHAVHLPFGAESTRSFEFLVSRFGKCRESLRKRTPIGRAGPHSPGEDVADLLGGMRVWTGVKSVIFEARSAPESRR